MTSSLFSHQVKNLKGTMRVTGDKSISHRSLMIGALAEGKTTVSGILESEDILGTANAMRKLGAEITQSKKENLWHIKGCGIGNLTEPDDILDMGNAGTGARLLMGILAGCPFSSFISGDESLRKRPMQRVITPLEQMGASFASRSKARLPLVVKGKSCLSPIVYESPVASAQVKSAILLAGLHADGETTVIEENPTRDHTERMLKSFGCNITTTKTDDGKTAITVTGKPELKACDIIVPADWSSAAFPAVAALITPDSEVFLPEVGMNPLRFGLFETLKEMGADIQAENIREIAGEPLCDIRAKFSQLKGVDVPPETAPSMIDEYPALAMAAACANGVTRMFGLGELRVKESNRLKAIADGLTACGVKIEVEKDALIVYGTGRPPKGNAIVATNFDHRIAMAFLVLGMKTEKPIEVDNASMIDTSFPNFATMMNKLGADIRKDKK